MNIRTDQVQALLRQQEQAAKKSGSLGGEGFGAALAQQVGLAGTDKSASIAMPPPGMQSGMIGQLLLTSTENTSATNPVDQVMQQAFEQATGALDMWDSYVNALGKPGAEGSLKEAYNLLQGVDAKVSALKQGAQPVLGQNPNLAGIINELEVLTTTEKIKFNRGDYS